MPTWLRRTLIAMAAAIGLLIAGIGIFVATFDANRYRQTLVDLVRERYQRKLTLDSPLSLSVFPRLGISVGAAALSEHASTAPFAHVDGMSLSVGVIPLLSGRVVVDRISLRGLQVSLARDAKGQWNFDDLLGKGEAREAPAQAPGKSPEAAGRPMDFDVSAVDIDDAMLKLRDDLEGRSGSVQVRKLHTGRLAPGAQTPVEVDASVAMSKPDVKLALSGSGKLTIGEALRSFGLEGTDMHLAGSAPGVQALDARLKGGLSYDMAASAVDAHDLDLSTSARLGTLRIDSSRLQARSLAYRPAQRLLAVDALKLDLAGAQGEEPLKLALDWPKLKADGDALSGSALSGSFSRGSMQGSFAADAPTGSFDEVRLPALRVQVQQSGEHALTAKLGAAVLLKLKDRSVALQGLSLDAHAAALAGAPALAVAAQGQADASASAAHWSLKGTLQGGAFDTTGAATFEGPTSVTAQARFDNLDLNALLPPPKPGAATEPSAAPAADTPVDLSPLRKGTARVSLRARQMAVRQFRLADVQADAQLDGGVLRLSKLAAGAWGGRLDAVGSADARANRVALKGAAQGVDIRALLKDVAGKELVEGTGRVNFDVDSAGRSVNEMKSHLHGTAAADIRDGAIRGVNLARLLRQAKAALSLHQDEVQKASSTEKTDFSQMSASFTIADGIARNSDLDLRSPFLRVGGNGQVDIGRGSIDYTVKATVADTSQGQGGADLAALRGLTVPVHLSGPLAAMSWNVQWSAVAAAAAQQAVKSKIQEQIGGKLGEKLGIKPPASASGPAAPASSPEELARQKLKDKLKGLFQR